MNRPLLGSALIVGIALALALTPVAHAKARCTRPGERVMAASPQLAVLAPSAKSGRYNDRKVCDRRSGVRRTLTVQAAYGSHQGASVTNLALHGQYAYAVLSGFLSNATYASLTTLNMRTGRKTNVDLALPDQRPLDPTIIVRELIAAPHGRSIVRVRTDFAAGIILTDARPGVAFLDEGLAQNIGRPRVRGSRAVWSHSGESRSSPVLLPDRCPTRVQRRYSIFYTPTDYLASAEAITIGSWFCVRETGQVGQVDGTVTRLRGPLAVVSRPEDVRAVDLRTGATVSGPVARTCASDGGCGATVGRSGTLVVPRNLAFRDTEVVAAAPGTPERQLARGNGFTVRYQDEIVRLRDLDTIESTELPLP